MPKRFDAILTLDNVCDSLNWELRIPVDDDHPDELVGWWHFDVISNHRGMWPLSAVWDSDFGGNLGTVNTDTLNDVFDLIAENLIFDATRYRAEKEMTLCLLEVEYENPDRDYVYDISSTAFVPYYKVVNFLRTVSR